MTELPGTLTVTRGEEGFQINIDGRMICDGMSSREVAIVKGWHEAAERERALAQVFPLDKLSSLPYPYKEKNVTGNVVVKLVNIAVKHLCSGTPGRHRGWGSNENRAYEEMTEALDEAGRAMRNTNTKLR